VNLCRAALSVVALPGWQAQAIAQESLHQHDHLPAIGRPHPGFGQGQGHMVIVAAFATAYAGKRRIH
jgi:hypothetical protein